MRRVCIKQEKLRVRQKLLDATEKSKNKTVLTKSPEAVPVPEKYSPEKMSSYSSRIPRYPIPSRSVISIASDTSSKKPNSKYPKFCHKSPRSWNKIKNYFLFVAFIFLNRIRMNVIDQIWKKNQAFIFLTRHRTVRVNRLENFFVNTI